MFKKRVIALFITIFSIIIMLEMAGISIVYLPIWQINKTIKQTVEKPREEWLERYKDVSIKSKYKVVFLHSNGVGDKATSIALSKAAENLGWQSLIFDYPSDHEQEIIEFNPDFIIIMHMQGHYKKPYIKTFSKQYILLDWPLYKYSFIDFHNFAPTIKEGYLKWFKHADGFLCSFKEISLLKKLINTDKSFEAIYFTPYMPKTTYNLIDPKQIVVFGKNWDPLRNSNRYQEFFKMLSNNQLIKVYGPKDAWNYIIESWKGFIQPQEIKKVIQDNGIVLVLHSNDHISDQLMSNRIMEAVSAGAMVISDRNPAIIENFGDNVLYIDHTASTEEIYKQIKSHYEWIKSHPKEVQAMTKRNHEIFLEKFTAEAGMINIAKMHEYILVNEKINNNKSH